MSPAPDVTLRPITPEDRDRLLDWRNLPEIARWMYSDHRISPEEHARWFTHALSDPARCYWIIQLDGRPVGLANLYDIALANRRAAWAYYLADPAVRGKGVGAYVEFWVIEHVFGALGLNKLWCEVLIANEAVWKLHQSFGFEREALFRAHAWKGGAAFDVVGLGLLASDWAAVRPACAQRLRDKGFEIAD
jgi:UDP-4-amino-4,6-dideoxy-N-acetyl-beta-L-altrosamine N-acetyltransferase